MKNMYLFTVIALSILAFNCMAQDVSKPETVTDADGNIYNTVKIGNQIWTVENLRTTKYNDGTPIPQVQDSSLWNELTTPGVCLYKIMNLKVGDNTIEAIYNGFAVNTKKLAPKGWHIPDFYEWITLQENTGGEYNAADKLTNDITTGFKAKASATRFYGRLAVNASAYWWTSTEVSDHHNVYFNISSTAMLHCNYHNAKSGFSIRLVKDSVSNSTTQDTHSMYGGISQSGTVADIDGNTYKTVNIGAQEWMAENLKTTKYRNGDLIETSKKPTTDLTKTDNPKYQWVYDANETNAAIYGRLYTWFAVTDNRNIAPLGWHVPTKWEWRLMKFYLLANDYYPAKSLATSTDWKTSTVKGGVGNTDFPEKRNTTGFNALPGGYRFNLGDNKFGPGTFLTMGSYAYWWTASEYKSEYKINYKTVIDVEKAFEIYITSDKADLVEDKSSKKDGLSVRCIKD